jgi:simple sugar transport system permease protein
MTAVTATRSLPARAVDVIVGRREASIALVAVALTVYFAAVSPAFLTVGNIRVIAQFTAAVAIIAAGEVMLLICGEIDLSAGHIFALSPFVMLFAMDAGIPMLAAIPIAMAAAGLVGLVNGVVTIRFGLPSFITTLGMLFLLQGITLIASGGFPKPAPRDGAIVQIFGGYSFSGMAWALVVAAIMHIVLTNTRWGVYTFATGGNPIGAQEAGVPTARVKVGNFVITAALAGFAGILESTRIASVDPLAGGADLMFFAVAASVIGGTALAGGSGTVIGGLLGALVLGVLRDGFTIQGISAFTFDVILGVAIIISMALNVRVARLRRGAMSL